MPILTPEERIGTVVAERYRLDAILGVGGMGVVFSGVHTWTGRSVAVKVLSPDYALNENIVQRFLQEARTAARLRHPNVVDVLDMGEDEDGTVFLALELLEGEPLADLIEREGPLPPAQTLELLLPVMQALYSAHRRGIIHRDIKPDNIFLSVDPAGNTVTKLLDFGIAKVLESAHSGTITGTVLGTPYYMSPEQAAGSDNIGPPADVWSMGVVIYECLAGKLPFSGTNPRAVLLSIACGTPEKLSAAAPHVPGPLAEAVDRALVPDRRTRYATIREFLDQLVAAATSEEIPIRVPVKIKSGPPPPAEPLVFEDPRGEGSRAFQLTKKRSTGGRPMDAGAATVAPDTGAGVDPHTPTMASTPTGSGLRSRLVGAPRRVRLAAGAGAAALLLLVVVIVAVSGSGSDSVAAQPDGVSPVAGGPGGAGGVAAASAAAPDPQPSAAAMPEGLEPPPAEAAADDEPEPAAEPSVEEPSEPGTATEAAAAPAPADEGGGDGAGAEGAPAAEPDDGSEAAAEKRRAERRARRRAARRASRAARERKEERSRSGTLFREW